MLLVTSSLLYVVADEQTKEDNEFHSIPEAMYLAVLMLTGQGTPDGELSPPMRLVVVFTAFLSVPFFAVPAAMLTLGLRVRVRVRVSIPLRALLRGAHSRRASPSHGRP